MKPLQWVRALSRDLASHARTRRQECRRSVDRLVGLLLLASLLVWAAPGACRTWHVPGDAPTIRMGLELASAGDDVLVAPGDYWEHDIPMKAGVWLHSEGGSAVTAVQTGSAGRGFDCRDLAAATTIEGFKVRDGCARFGSEEDASGGGVRCINSSLTMRDCIIELCSAEMYGGGAYVTHDPGVETSLVMERCIITLCSSDYVVGGLMCRGASVVRLADCEIRQNEAYMCGGATLWCGELAMVRSVFDRNFSSWGGPGGVDVQATRVAIEDCRFTANVAVYAAAALALRECSGTVTGCTFTRNNGEPTGAVIGLSMSDVFLDRSIIAFNNAYSILCDDVTDLSRQCCDDFGNWLPDQCGHDLGGNFMMDPLFCDWANGDYTLDAESPCLPGNHPGGEDCGLIGALGQGCGTLPSGACCLADGSCTVVDEPTCQAQSGAYQGDGSTCEPDPCEPTAVEGTTWGRIRASFR